jgi:hypothetical protein
MVLSWISTAMYVPFLVCVCDMRMTDHGRGVGQQPARA